MMLLSISLLAGVAGSVGVPANDTCATPTVISGEGNFTYDTTGATTSGFTGAGAPCALPPGTTAFEDDVFFVWSTDTDGAYAFNAASPDMLDQIALYEGADCSAVCMQLNFQPGPNEASGVSLFTAPIQAGQDYLLQAGSWGPDESASCTLSIVRLLVHPNVVCSESLPIVGEASQDWNNGNVWTSFPEDPANVEPGCTTPYADLFFTWTCLCDGDYRIHTENTAAGVDTILAVMDGPSCADPCLGWNDDLSGTDVRSEVLINGALAGERYLIQVGTPAFTGDQGPGNLSIERVGSPCPVIEVANVCDPANTHVDGGSTRLIASWIPGASGTGLHLEAVDGPAGRTGLFIMAQTVGSPIPVNQGTLCMTPPFARYHPQPAQLLGVPGINSVGQFDVWGTGVFEVFGGSVAGTGFDVPTETPAHPAGALILPGDTWSFQLWHRDLDPMGNQSSNFSNAIAITF